MESIVRTKSKTFTLKGLKQLVEKTEPDSRLLFLVIGEDKKRYQILETLGEGKDGDVFLALHGTRFIAVKMSYKPIAGKRLFESLEKKAAGDYKQFFLIPLEEKTEVAFFFKGEVSAKNKCLFDAIVFLSFWEYADDIVENKSDESFENKLLWFCQFLQGLEMFHRDARLHLDIKPANLFIVNNRLKIGDFDFSAKEEDFRKAGYLCGTSGYIAPEMFYDRGKISCKVDVYSAGITFARLFTGKIPGLDIPLDVPAKKQLAAIKRKCKKQMQVNFDREISDIITTNFIGSIFYKKILTGSLEVGNPSDPEVFIYKEILLEMMEPDPDKRPAVETILGKIKRWQEEKKPKPPVKYGFNQPLLAIPGSNTIIVNLRKKKVIKMGRRDENSPAEPGNDIYFRFYNISRAHLQILFKETPGRVYVEDRGSTFGTFVNGTPLLPGKVLPLKNGDILRMGKIICFEFLEREGSFLLKNVTQREKKGLIAWLSTAEGEEGDLPAANAEILLLRNFATINVQGRDIRLEIEKKSGNILSDRSVKIHTEAILI